MSLVVVYVADASDPATKVVTFIRAVSFRNRGGNLFGRRALIHKRHQLRDRSPCWCEVAGECSRRAEVTFPNDLLGACGDSDDRGEAQPYQQVGGSPVPCPSSSARPEGHLLEDGRTSGFLTWAQAEGARVVGERPASE
jgi:hypothetical protein